MFIHGISFNGHVYNDKFVIKDTIHAQFIERCDQESITFYEESMESYKNEQTLRIQSGDYFSEMNDPVPPKRKYPKRAPGADNYNFQMETGRKNRINPYFINKSRN